MGVVSVQNVSKQYDAQIVLRDVSLELRTGETVGLVGANGAGKTTLFRLIAGELEPDAGTVTSSKGLEIGYLPQDPQIDLERTLHDEVGRAFSALLEMEAGLHQLTEAMAEHGEGPQLGELMARYDRLNARFTARGGYSFVQRLNEVLGGLGFAPSDYDLPMSALSGGQRCRAALAKMLLQDRQFLLLDEPTNHLDIDAVRWLEKFLAGHHGGAVVVSHDRYFLDRLADRIIEIEGGRIETFPGNYSNYVQTKHRRRLTRDRQYEIDRAFIEKERDFIARHHAGQRSKEVKGRQTRLERRLAAGEFVLEKSRARRTVKFSFDDVGSDESTVARIEGLSKSYGGKALFEGLSFSVAGGSRFGVTGPNGVGKTTMLKIMMGEVEAEAGTVEWGRKLNIGYYAQVTAHLDSERTILDEIASLRTEMSEQQIRSYLGGFQFTGDDVFKRIDELSGGEQSRLRLIKLILSGPNVLVLDEPTNHLDIASREALEEALAAFPGTVIAVSHDRYFLDRLVDHLLVLRSGGHRVFPGNYSDYIEEVERAREAEREKGKPSRGPSRRRGADGAAGTTPRRAASEYDRLTVDELSAMIEEREDRVAAVTKQFGAPEVYRDPEAAQRLQEELAALKAELAKIEAAWADRIENA